MTAEISDGLAGRLQGLSEAATQGEWRPDGGVSYDEDGAGPGEFIIDGVAVDGDPIETLFSCREDDAVFIAELVNAYRSGRLGVTSPASLLDAARVLSDPYDDRDGPWYDAKKLRDAVAICPDCRGERRVSGKLCPRCGGCAQIARAELNAGEKAPFEPEAIRPDDGEGLVHALDRADTSLRYFGFHSEAALVATYRAAIARPPQAPPAGGTALTGEECANCGSVRSLAAIRAMGFLSCCPERRMVAVDHSPAALGGETETTDGNLYRVGRKVPRNVYRGDEPQFMAASDSQAAWLVAVLNAGEAALRAADPTRGGNFPQEPCDCLLGDCKRSRMRCLDDERAARFAAQGSGDERS